MDVSEATTRTRQPVNSIVEQHVEEAAFCWLRREDALWRPNINLNQFYRIDQRLDAHLEGLRLAAETAWPYAQKRMSQWKTADEVFVASYLAIHTSQTDQLNAIANIARADMNANAGISAALQCTLQLSGKDKALTAIQFFWQQQDSLKSAVIDTALQIPEINTHTLLSTAISSTDATLRTKALEAIGRYQLKDYIPALFDALRDSEPRCQLAASESLAILGKPEHQRATIKQLPILNRSDRLKHLLVWASTSSENDFNNGLQTIDTNVALSDFIWANAFRGNSNALARLSALLEHKIAAPLAAYAIHHITGIDLDSVEESEQLPTESSTQDESEINLPTPIKQLLRETEGLTNVAPTTLKQSLANQWGSYPENEKFLSGTSISDPSLAPGAFCAMPQHWHRALIVALAGEAAEWSKFPQPFFIYN